MSAPLALSRAEIEEAIDLQTMAMAIEDAYRASSAGEVELPPVGHITFPEVDGDCHIKFGHRRGDPNFVIKIATGFPEQVVTGAPTGNGLLLILSAVTGQVEAILHDEMLLTDIRTGIGGAIATRLLARKDASRLLIVGTGVQARCQIKAHVALVDQELDIRVWGRSPEAAASVVRDVAPDVISGVVADLSDACGNADIIVTTTAARTPLIDASWIRPGVHITAIGADAPGKHELDPRLLGRADVLAADSRAQCIDHGELSAIDPARHAAIVEIGELLAGQPGRQRPDEVTIADLTGIAAQDIATARCTLEILGQRNAKPS